MKILHENRLKLGKTLASNLGKMYLQLETQQTSSEDFEFPAQLKLSKENRWVIMAELIPWFEFEAEYAQIFDEKIGAPAKPFRMALGALIIKEILGLSDRETVEQIKENPYLQYFLGLKLYSNEAPFDASMLVHFRQRINQDIVDQINKRIVKNQLVKDCSGLEVNQENLEANQENLETNQENLEVNQENLEVNQEILEDKKEITNKGKLLIDASCAEADIRYPNDLWLLNEVRKQTEKIIEKLYKLLKGKLNKKPRTYRKKARKDYLKVAKKRKPKGKEVRVAIRKQLQYIKRNLSHIEKLIEAGSSLEALNKKEKEMLLVVQEVYEQQLWMYENKKHSIEGRIVSLTQPHIRPIVRGKAGKSVEFGAKISASCVDGYIFLDRVSWENFNESKDFKKQVEKYKEYTGYYPESVHVDKIYRTRENRKWCKERGIRMSGPRLGRPPANLSAEMKKQAQLDERIRNGIEGKFGQAKRRLSLNRIMAKLPETSETTIAITFLVINLITLFRRENCGFFWLFFPKQIFLGKSITINYHLSHNL